MVFEFVNITGQRLVQTAIEEIPCTRQEHQEVNRLCCWEVAAVAAATPAGANCLSTRQCRPIIQGTINHPSAIRFPINTPISYSNENDCKTNST